MYFSTVRTAVVLLHYCIFPGVIALLYSCNQNIKHLAQKYGRTGDTPVNYSKCCIHGNIEAMSNWIRWHHIIKKINKVIFFKISNCLFGNFEKSHRHHIHTVAAASLFIWRCEQNLKLVANRCCLLLKIAARCSWKSIIILYQWGFLHLSRTAERVENMKIPRKAKDLI